MTPKKLLGLTAVVVAVSGLASSCRQRAVDTLPEQTPTPPASQPAEPARPSAGTEVTEPNPTEPVQRTEIADEGVDALNARGVLKTIYFEYDSDVLSDEARAALQDNAKWLRGNPQRTIRIEGHADDRGTIEYNLSLGQRRADSVREYLSSLGVDVSTVEVISYGEERPATDGESESAWSKNRRAEFRIVS